MKLLKKTATPEVRVDAIRLEHNGSSYHVDCSGATPVWYLLEPDPITGETRSRKVDRPSMSWLEDALLARC